MSTPLRRYFDAHPDENHAAFAARSGISIDTIRSYARAARPRLPGIAMAMAIEKATAGEVRVEHWAEWAQQRDAAEATAIVSAAPAAIVPVVDAEVISVEDRRPPPLDALKAVGCVVAVGFLLGWLG